MVLGCALLASTSGAAPAASEQGGFGVQDLATGYELERIHGEDAEGKCGEGKCGADSGKKDGAEGKCGEGKCGADGEKEKGSGEGKCGEGKCGEKKQ